MLSLGSERLEKFQVCLIAHSKSKAHSAVCRPNWSTKLDGANNPNLTYWHMWYVTETKCSKWRKQQVLPDRQPRQIVGKWCLAVAYATQGVSGRDSGAMIRVSRSLTGFEVIAWWYITEFLGINAENQSFLIVVRPIVVPLPNSGSNVHRIRLDIGLLLSVEIGIRVE